MNSIDFGDYRSKVQVTMGIIDKFGVRGDAMLCVVIFHLFIFMILALQKLYSERAVMAVKIVHHLWGSRRRLFGKLMAYTCLWVPSYRKISVFGFRVILRISNADLRNLYIHVVLSDVWEIKATRVKICQITTNYKHFAVENVLRSYPSTICTCGGSEVLQNTFF